MQRSVRFVGIVFLDLNFSTTLQICLRYLDCFYKYFCSMFILFSVSLCLCGCHIGMAPFDLTLSALLCFSLNRYSVLYLPFLLYEKILDLSLCAD